MRFVWNDVNGNAGKIARHFAQQIMGGRLGNNRDAFSGRVAQRFWLVDSRQVNQLVLYQLVALAKCKFRAQI